MSSRNNNCIAYGKWCVKMLNLHAIIYNYCYREHGSELSLVFGHYEVSILGIHIYYIIDRFEYLVMPYSSWELVATIHDPYGVYDIHCQLSIVNYILA